MNSATLPVLLSAVYDSTRDVYLADGADIDPATVDVERLAPRAIHPATVHAIVAACGIGTVGRERGRPIGRRILARVDVDARTFDPSAPDALDSLARSMMFGEYPNGARWYRVPVSDVGIGGSIYGSDPVNALFRAWHDVVHVDVGARFDSFGESTVAESMARELASLRFGPLAILPILADVVANDQWFRSCGRFPSDPIATVSFALAGFRGAAPLAPGCTLTESNIDSRLLRIATRGQWRECIDELRANADECARLGIGA